MIIFANSDKKKHLESWQELYGKLAGNQLHSINAFDSKFFQEFIGKSESGNRNFQVLIFQL